jgi:hypothetical protein
VGGQLMIDAVIRVSGKVSARDRDGNLSAEMKIIADDIQVVDDAELRSYESHGNKMAKPKAHTAGVMAKRNIAATKRSEDGKTAKAKEENAKSNVTYTVLVEPIKKLFVHIKDPDNQAQLVELKQICSQFPGVSEIVLVLGADKKSAIKMPFRVDGSDNLIGRLVKVLGEDSVVYK